MRFEEIGGEHELCEVTMIRKDLNGGASLSEEVAILGERMDNGVEFLIVNVPAFFGGVEFVMEEKEGMPAVLVFLLEYPGVSFIGGVGGEAGRSARNKSPEEDVVANSGDDAFKGGLAFGSPVPRNVLLQEIVKASDRIRIVWDEFVIKANNPKKRTEIRDTSRGFKITDALDLVGGHADTFPADDGETKEVTLLCIPVTFVWFEAEVVFGEGFKYFKDARLVFFAGSLSVDDNIIQVGVAEDSKEGVEDAIDESLEDRRRGGESHGYDGVFKEAIGGFEGGSGLRAWTHAYVRKAGADVHGGNPVCAGEIVHHGPCEWDGVFVQLNLAVEVSVIDHEAKLSGAGAGGGVSYEEDGCGGG